MTQQDSRQQRRAPPNPSSILPSDPRYPIWGRVFLCQVPRIVHYSTQYLERYGLPSSGSPTIDRALASQLAPCYLTIDRMVELYHQHQTVSISRQEDVKTIYEICQDYTFDWADTLRTSIYTQNVPFTDLIKLDEFSEAVYKYAAHMYGTEFARTFLPEGVMRNAIDMKKMFDAVDNRLRDRKKKDYTTDGYTVANVYSRLPKKNNPQAAEEAKEKELPERPSVRDIFTSYMENFGDRL